MSTAAPRIKLSKAEVLRLTYTVFDEAVGEEVERLEVVPCRRCADSR